MTVPHLMAFLVPTLALNLTPGPDMFFVIGQATKGGPRAAAKAATGLCLGYLFHIALVTAGLAALLTRYPQAFTLMKFLGASYLLILGTKMLLTKKAAAATANEPAALWEGIFVSALNPKVAIFFLAFLPQFIEPGIQSPALQLALLGLLFSFTSTIVNTSAGLLAWSMKKSGRRRGFSLERICGAALVGMAAKLALAR